MAGKSPSAQQCFVMMPYAEEFKATYEAAIEPAVTACHLACVRADRQPGAGVAFEKLHEDIRNASICVADLTNNRPNVAAEVGIAIALGIPVVMITRDEFGDLPFDFRHYRVIRYNATNVGHRDLAESLQASITATLGPVGSPVSLLKQMLVPSNLPEVEPYVVAASPLPYRRARAGVGGFESLRGTSGDHAGVRGLIQAFGLIFGLNRLPELVNPNDYAASAASNPNTPMSLYTIGAPKSNRWTGVMIKQMHQRWQPRLAFKPDPLSEDLRDVRVAVDRDGSLYMPPGYRLCPRSEWDFGLVIRTPHPFYADRMLLVLAGRSGVGTHAACLTATDPQHISQIKAMLETEGVDLDDYTQPFWAVAHIACLKEPGRDAPFDLASLRVSVVERFRPVSGA